MSLEGVIAIKKINFQVINQEINKYYLQNIDGPLTYIYKEFCSAYSKKENKTYS